MIFQCVTTERQTETDIANEGLEALADRFMEIGTEDSEAEAGALINFESVKSALSLLLGASVLLLVPLVLWMLAGALGALFFVFTSPVIALAMIRPDRLGRNAWIAAAVLLTVILMKEIVG